MRRTHKAMLMLILFLSWTIATSFSFADGAVDDAQFDPEWESVALDNGGVVAIDEDETDEFDSEETEVVVVAEPEEDEAVACLPVDEVAEDGELELTIDDAPEISDSGAITIQSLEMTAYPTVGISDDEAISGYINQQLYASQERVSSRAQRSMNVAGSRLGDDVPRVNLYNAFKTFITQVAKGEAAITELSVPIAEIYPENQGFTAEDLGVDAILVDNNFNVDAQKAFLRKQIGDRLSVVINALMVDMPYELYWYDKTIGTSYSCPMTYAQDMLKFGSYESGTIKFKFAVAGEYSLDGARGTYATDQSKIQSIEEAAENARNIVRECSGYDDIAKLTAYKDRICELVSYNFDAVNNNYAYGNPWQLVWVFDNDPTTNVVCEGYSKAFQYLCELSTFTGKITVVTAFGTMVGGTGAGAHMWNNVAIGSGANRATYLVDVTNCDEGSVGYPDLLFLKGYSVKDENSYYIDVGETKSIRYTYDDKYVRLFSAEDLELSSSASTPSVTEPYAGTYGAVTWALDDAGVLSISGEGAIPASIEGSAAPWLAAYIRNDVLEVRLGEGITGLGDGVFSGLSGMTRITLASTTTQFGDNVFDGSGLFTDNADGIIIPSCENAAALAYAKALFDAGIAFYEVTHANVVESEAVAPSCTETGLTAGKHCEVCGEVTVAQEIVPAKGHTEVVDEAVEASCTETGLTAGKHCEVCGEVTVAQEVVPAKGHTEVVDEAVEASCTETGLTAGKHCEVCGEVTVAQEVVPAKGHTEVVDEAVEASCTETGLTAGKHCEVCGEVTVAQEIVPAKGHTEVVDEAVEASCTETGLTEGKHCEVCGEVTVAQEIVPAKGHSEVVDEAVEPTYTETGLTAGSHCAVCGEVIVPQEIIDKLEKPQTTEPEETETPEPTETETPKPTETETPAPEETETPAPEETETPAPEETETPAPEETETPAPEETETPEPEETETPEPEETETPEPEETETPAPEETETPAPEETETPAPVVTAVPAPVVTAVPVPVVTAVPAPVVTPTPAPTAAPVDYTVHVTKNTSKKVDKGTPLQIVTDGKPVKSYKSSNKKVATVSKSGWVTTKKAGTAKITVTLKNKKKLTLKITVVDPYTPKSVKLLQGKSAALKVGQTLGLTPSLSPATARSAFKWKSSNKKIATVNQQGVVTAKKPGKVKITVTTGNKKTATITIKVTK